MSQIFFKRKFIDAIRRGDKTTTLRRWKSCRLKAGSRAYVPGFGWLSILSCGEIELKDLSQADALADGFKSLTALKKTLAQIYPNCASDGRRWFRVIFRVEELKTTPEQDARKHVAHQIRSELDKIVRQSGSLFQYEQRGDFAACRPRGAGANCSHSSRLWNPRSSSEA
jgi:hypothetical protein